MKRRAELLWRFFTGKRNAFAIQKPDGVYLKIERELTLKVLEDHAAGRITVATYPVVSGTDRVQFSVIDLDSKSPQCQERMLWLKRWLEQKGFNPLVEPSGFKGYHLWLLFKSWIPAAKAQRLLRQAVNTAEEKFGRPNYGLEVFPKQTTGTGFGSAIKLPWGIHRKTGRHTAFVEDDLSTVLPHQGADAVEGLPVVEEAVVDELLAEWAPEEIVSGRRRHKPEEIVEMLARPLTVGERRPTLVKLAGYLRFRGIPEEVALALLLPWAQRSFQEPLSDEEIERHIRGIYRRYGVGRGNIPQSCRCDKLEVPL